MMTSEAKKQDYGKGHFELGYSGSCVKGTDTHAWDALYKGSDALV